MLYREMYVRTLVLVYKEDSFRIDNIKRSQLTMCISRVQSTNDRSMGIKIISIQVRNVCMYEIQ